MNVLEILKAARAKIVDPANWTQGDYAKDEDGDPMYESQWANEPPACMCSIGAVAVAAGTSICETEKSAAVRFLDQAVEGPGASRRVIADYNDSHTREEVLAAFDKAIELAQAELIVTNLETLLAAVEAYPETNLNLSTYKCDDTECGTLYCVAGLAATLPHFNAQGMRFGVDGVICMADDGYIGHDSCTDPMFGPDAWYNLFATFGNGNRDEAIGAYVNGNIYKRAMSDKQLAIARLKLQIEAVKGAA